METLFIKGLQLFLSLSLLIFVHELGHFFWARIFGVRVDKFYLFFDTEKFALFRWKPKGSDTEYGIGWIPFGGYCKIAGMIDESMDKEQLLQEPKPWEYRTQSTFRRFMIISGGVLNNLITAFLIYVAMMWTWGKDVLEMRSLDEGMQYSEYAQELGFRHGDIIWAVDGDAVDYTAFPSRLLLANDITVKRGGELLTIALPDSIGQYFLRDNAEVANFARLRFPMVVSEVVEDGGAYAAGLMQGDSVIAVNGTATHYYDEVQALLEQHAGDTIQLSFVRQGELYTLPVLLSSDAKLGVLTSRPMVPIERSTHVEYNFWQAIPAGFDRCCEVMTNYVRQFKLVFTKEGAKSLGGFATMGSIFPDTWNWGAFWSLTAFFSLALAFMNILPIPALDGGHLLFVLYEMIFRRKPSDKFLEYAQTAGFFLVFGLLILVNLNDIWKFVISKFF